MARDDDDDDRPRKRRPPDDDDDDYRPRKKARARDEDDNDMDDDDRPRKRGPVRDDAEDENDGRSSRRRDENEEEEDRPRKKKKKRKPLPGSVLAAAIVSFIWGALTLLGNCYSTVTNLHGWMELQRAEQVGFRVGGGFNSGLAMSLALSGVFTILAAVVLIVGGILLLMRKNLGRSLALGAAIAMIVVNLIGFVGGMIAAGGGIFGFILIGLVFWIVFDVGICICIYMLLGSPNAIRALK
jgi:hypothetical protein